MRPPRWLRLLAALVLPPEDREFILGDLQELYFVRVRRRGAVLASLACLRDLLGSGLARHSHRRSFGRSMGRMGGTDPRPPSSGWGRAPTAMVSDLRHAFRSLGRQPLFSLVAIVTLGIGVGSAGAVFGIVNQLLLRPVPGVVEPDRLARVEIRSPERRAMSVSGPVAEELRAFSEGIEGFASFDYLPLVARVEDRRPLSTRGYTIFGDYFELLGVRPASGRLLAASETGPDGDPTRAVISETLWISLFDRDPRVVGRRFEANGFALTVVGVAGNGFRGTDRFWPVDVWVARSAFAPLDSYPAERLWSPESRLLHDHVVRLRPGIEPDAVEARLTSILRGRAAEGADPTLADARASLSRGLLEPQLAEGVRAIVAILGAVALLVLLIPCANVANLLLVRSSYRRGELAVHRAMGASVGRIARRHIVESLVLAALGTGTGLVVARLIGWTYRGTSLMGLRGLEGFVLDRRALAFAALAVVGTTLLFGVVPALLAGRFDLSASLRRADARATGRDGSLQRRMASLQIALSLPLLVGGVLLGRTLQNVQGVHPGMDPEGVWVTTIDLGLDSPQGDELDALLREVERAAGGQSGVEGAAVAPYGPYAGMRPRGRIARLDTGDAEPTTAEMRWVGPGWFELMGMQPTAGRTFREEDWTPAGPRSVVLTEPLARRLFGEEPPVGRIVHVGLRELDEARVVGVVGEIRIGDLRSQPDELFFLSYPIPGLTGTVTPHVRFSSSDPEAAERVQTALESALPDLPVPALVPLTDRIEGHLSEQCLYARLLGLLAALAVLVAGVGLYGVVAFTVANRRREFGIRCTLGADRGAIAGLALRSATNILASGTLLGLLSAYGLARLIENRLFGVAALDPLSYLGAAGLLALISGVACGIPAMSAMRLDPVETLRAD